MFRPILCMVILIMCSSAPLAAQVGLQLNGEPWLLSDTANLPQVKKSKSNFFQQAIPFSIVSTKKSIASAVIERQPELGLFCQLDANMDSKLPYRLRFRLGEFHYVQEIEGYYDLEKVE